MNIENQPKPGISYALSTNWCNRRLESGDAIVDEALSLGFDALELGFRTSESQAREIAARRGEMPVGSVHAFCPVPVSAPTGYPELYALASFDEDQRALARAHVKRNIAFTASVGADTLVLHAGRVAFGGFFSRCDSGTLKAAIGRAGGDRRERNYMKLLGRAMSTRAERGSKMLDIFKKEVDALIPELEKSNVTLAFENLPYLEGFPNEGEMASILESFPNAPVGSWFDTGHQRVRWMHGWTLDRRPSAVVSRRVVGMHLNDVIALEDDHLPPGEGCVDFAALKSLARSARHVVVEPSSTVSAESLRAGLDHIRRLWS